jgi:7-dehydrocholesterol reductase
MILVNLLHALYVLDFFYNEEWYLSTIDMAHDHFGWMLAWGDTVWLPFMYTLPAFYLVSHPVQLSYLHFHLVLLLGLVGYCIFRGANWEKEYFRATRGTEKIWGRQPSFISSHYTTLDGKTHHSMLLTSGFWGICRHINYFGDILMAISYGLACFAFEFAVLPFFYAIFLTVLLVHRAERCHDRCMKKHGRAYQEYCQKVPIKIVPFIW